MWVVTENYQLLDGCIHESLHVYEIAEKTPTTILYQFQQQNEN